MALVTGGRSTLNPNAPLFIPAAFRQVEDFSPEWWQLITTSTWFRDYWLSQHQEEDIFNCNNADDEFDANDIADLLPDAFDFGTEEDFSHMEAQFEEFIQSSEAEEANKPSHLALNGTSGNGSAVEMDVNALMKFTNERGPKSLAEPAKYQEKAGRCMSPKCSPRLIQQPR